MGGGTGALTPLQAAAQKSEINIARELLRRGACINAPAAPDHGRTALQAACEGGRRSEEMISLLLEEGADFLAPPAPRYGRTALQALCCSENPSSELVAFLIDRGADINAPAADCGGLTALQGAALVGNIKIAVLLMEKGANVNALPSRQEGRMALDGAAEYGRLDTVQLLLTLGATCTVPGGSGYDSAVNFAEDNGHFAIVDMLRSRNKQSEGELFDVNMC
ncbi:ankyrin repeat-containing domain protein [Bisporella sp. PMI_857]|nr:ankyrin repeat-containing domain protein [Bisporella sp. PMI_857]